MFSRSSWLHIRVPFSYFLLPVFLFSLSASPNFTEPRLFWVFFIIHFLLYPASNGYNSYFDKDEKSIGGLKNPPPVKKELYYFSLALDILAIVLGYLKINFTFAFMILVYGLMSKAYSHPAIRLKKYPIAGWLIVSVFQGFFTFVMCYVGVNNFEIENALQTSVLVPAILSSALLLGTYPMTQIYQHQEDGERGDKTFSMLLGIRGTFYFVGGIFTVVFVLFILYFNAFFNSTYSLHFLGALSPVITYFFYWFLKVLRDESKADHGHTMWLNFTSATCLNIFFVYLFLESSQVLQAIQAGY